MKKLISLVLALVMVMGLAASASAASITITPPSNAGGTETGITYIAYKIFDATISGNNVAYTIKNDSPYYDTIAAATEYFTLTEVAGAEGTFVVTATAAYTAEVADTFADTLKAVVADAAGTLTKQTDGTYKLDGLADGYYLVTSSVGADLILDTIGDITVTTKNTYPSQEKKVEGMDETTADMGEVLNFTITVNIPANAVGEIVVHDKMTGLEYQSMTEESGISVATFELGDDCAVHFTLSDDFVAANKGQSVTIAYKAKVTADVANNESWLVDDTYTTTTDHVDVYSTDVVINKVIAGTTTPLKGAEFVLMNATNQYYKVDNNGNVTWVGTQADATKVTTDDMGYAEFTDIADGTYYLVETKAPTGYNLLTEKVPVTVTATKGTNEEGNTVVVDITVKVENNSGTELPSTGGMGTTMMYIAGGLLVAAAVVLLIAKRRMNAAE